MRFLTAITSLFAVVTVAYAGYAYTEYQGGNDQGSYSHGGGYEQGLSEQHYDVGPIQVPLNKDGTPIDDEHVAAAKANHLAAHKLQLARLQAYKYGYATAEHDAPIESPEVQYARFQHMAAYEQAKQLEHNPALVKSLLPVDAPEVQIAKKEHEERVQHIKYRNLYAAYSHGGHDQGQEQEYHH